MSTTADQMIVYEDRDEVRTSRWKLDGLSTLVGGNAAGGWLTATLTGTPGGTATATLKSAAGTTLASGTASLATLPVKLTLTASGGSGVSGELYIEEYVSQPANPIPVMVALCDDAALLIEYANIADLPGYSVTLGMADFCIAATKKVLLLVSQQFAEQLGGFGVPEHRNIFPNADRSLPDYRAIVNPDQLQEATVHWALVLAFGRNHERASDTMYSELRDFHDKARAEAISEWNLTFSSDPSGDADADSAKGVGQVQPTRL